MRLVVLLVFSTGCIAASVKAHTGVVTDERSTGVQAGISVGIGYAGKRSAVVESIGFAGGQAPKAGLAVGLDYVHLPEDKPGFAWRAGIGGIPLAYGDPSMAGIRVATLFIFRDRSSYGGHEKSFQESTRFAHALGLEAMVGMATHGQFSEMPETYVGGSASVTYELYMLSRLW